MVFTSNVWVLRCVCVRVVSVFFFLVKNREVCSPFIYLFIYYLLDTIVFQVQPKVSLHDNDDYLQVSYSMKKNFTIKLI